MPARDRTSTHTRTARFDQRPDDVGVNAVLEPIAQQRREVLLAGQAEVIRHEHTVRREPPQLVSIGVVSGYGFNSRFVICARAAVAALGDDLAEMREQE